MSGYVTVKTGGSARQLIYPETAAELTDISKSLEAAGSRYYILGRGSNVLIPDEGVGIIVSTLMMNKVSVEANKIICEAGAMLPAVAVIAAKAGLSGLEELAGIPATVGGALRMNAGAFGKEIKDILYCPPGNMNYRQGINDAVILSAVLELTPDSPEKIFTRMNEFKRIRQSRQPNEPSFGCAFKNIPHYVISAGKLIDECGLKGIRIGDAEISSTHANFIINKGRARTCDILNIMDIVEKVVYNKTGIILEREVEVLCQS